MKTFFFLFSFFFLWSITNAQPTAIQLLLNNYLQLKDAFVKSDGKTAVDLAVNMQLIIENIKQEELDTAIQQPFSVAKSEMLAALQKIARKADLEKQRPAFAGLSVLLWPLIKASGNLDQRIYYDYCPMKKAYWISTETTIRNPYFGAAMLSCGNVAEQKN